MISAIVHTAIVSLRRDRGALALSFILPVVFFSIFAVIFGGRRDSTPKVKVLLVDEDHSEASQRLVKGLHSEGSLVVATRPAPVKGAEQPEYTAATAEAAVKAGTASVALIIPHGFGESPISFGSGAANRPSIQMLEDNSDMVAPQVVAGLLQKVAMTSMPDIMAEQGSKYIDQFAGGAHGGTAEANRPRSDLSAPAAAEWRSNNWLGQRRAGRGHDPGGRRREQEQPDGVFLRGGHWSDVPAVHGERGGGRFARGGRERHTRPRAQLARHDDLVVVGQAGLQLLACLLATGADVPVGLGRV